MRLHRFMLSLLFLGCHFKPYNLIRTTQGKANNLIEPYMFQFHNSLIFPSPLGPPARVAVNQSDQLEISQKPLRNLLEAT